MPTAYGAPGPQLIYQDSEGYPDRLIERLGAGAPPSVSIVGSSASLSLPMTALLCSRETPGSTILRAFDQAARWRDQGQCVISGFHSPLERQCLDILLRGKQPVLMAPARGIGTLRLPVAQRKALDEGRLTIVSPFAASVKRVNGDLARQRNLFIAALADEVVFAFISPGGSLDQLWKEVQPWRVTSRILVPTETT